jgi:phospholipase C
MPYPAMASQLAVSVSQSVRLPFRPAAAGLVTFSAVAVGLEAPLPPGTGGSDTVGNTGTGGRPAPAFTVGLRIEIFKPGSATPVATNTGELRYQPGTTPVNQLVVATYATAAAEDLQADWVAVATNTGTSPANQSLLVRYQTMPGNLGKIDHIIVLMMENRSFDHMLGYLSLTGGRGDVDGLRGGADGMSNPDASGGRVPINALGHTFFLTDPGHGWTDVTEQLEFDITTGKTNGGFVRNFAKMCAVESTRQIMDQQTAASAEPVTFAFQPSATGTISIQCVPSFVPKQASSGLLASITLTGPGSPAPVASANIPITSGVGRLTYNATGSIPAPPADWVVQITNRSDDTVQFTTTVTYPWQVEPANSIMGYYDGTALPTYNFLAQHYTICDRWFASLPTDTWPNRLYALTGGSGGLDTTPSGSGVASNPPGYTLETIFEVLQQRSVDWKIYYSDLPYALIFQRPAQDATYTQRMRPVEELLRGAETGDLPSVSWVDPSFLDVQEALAEESNASDDHPPGDVTNGQHLVWQIYDALSRGPSWPKTLLLITYDEHGGFFDHVLPPGTPIQEQPAPGSLPTQTGVLEPPTGTPGSTAGTGTLMHAIHVPGSPPPTPPAVQAPTPIQPHPVAPMHVVGTAATSLSSPTDTPTASSPADAPADDNPRFTRYGLRVPALVVSPWAPSRNTDHATYDHTSLIATVLNRFCADNRPSMGARADHANDVSAILAAETPYIAPPALEPPHPPPAGEIAVTPSLDRGSFGELLRQTIIGF